MTVGKMMEAGAGELETFIPLVDVLINAYATQKGLDSRGLHALDVLRHVRQQAGQRYLMQTGKEFKLTDRTLQEKIKLNLFGTEPEERESEWESFQDALGGSRTDFGRRFRDKIRSR